MRYNGADWLPEPVPFSGLCGQCGTMVSAPWSWVRSALLSRMKEYGVPWKLERRNSCDYWGRNG